MKLIEAMKKEFRLLRIVWRQIYDQVNEPLQMFTVQTFGAMPACSSIFYLDCLGRVETNLGYFLRLFPLS